LTQEEASRSKTAKVILSSIAKGAGAGMLQILRRGVASKFVIDPHGQLAKAA
jgi:hypothetical protein